MARQAMLEAAKALGEKQELLDSLKARLDALPKPCLAQATKDIATTAQAEFKLVTAHGKKLQECAWR